ncbi:MAG: hypothetical protein GF344_04275 [Chitinivibrionales bacterium]|nr:hypothetical protein [Chitinivibrionales bacterium]MBD3356261.1 hypothetical protein [Chitinivibrionales bacterium]
MNIPFEIRMNNPFFSVDLLRKVFYGNDIPYNLATKLKLSLVDPLTEDTLDFTTQRIDVVTDSPATRPDSSTMALLVDAASLSLNE